jgi:hypothetical protein
VELGRGQIVSSAHIGWGVGGGDGESVLHMVYSVLSAGEVRYIQ